MEPEPSRKRLIVCALVVAAVMIGLWAYVALRSAAPPPPTVEIPR